MMPLITRPVAAMIVTTVARERTYGVTSVMETFANATKLESIIVSPHLMLFLHTL